MSFPSASQKPSPSSQFEYSLASALTTFEQLNVLQPKVVKAAALVGDTLLAGYKLMICGNGGSASDSAHIATEFTCRFCDDRRPYPAMAFTVDGGLMTAIGNDYHFETVFQRQVAAFGKKGDLFIVLSTSGNSRNLLLALEEAKERGIQTIAFLGKTGGFTAGVADLEIVVPGTVTARIQEAQKFLLHVLCEIVEERLPK
ncbi:MAG: D-sedoheptulose-7-phosphate isomerase [Chthoniobacterales bacterium]